MVRQGSGRVKADESIVKPVGRSRLAAFAVSFSALLFVGWSARFLARASIGALDGRRYFALFDDALVSMRYAWNLSHGQGLVWNPGERVEGYSNLLSTLLMSATTAVFDRRLAPLAVQVAGVATVLAAAALAFRLARLATAGDLEPVRSALPALAFAGTLEFDPLHGTLTGSDGRSFRFTPPEAEELPRDGFARGEEGYEAPAADGDSVTVEIPPDSQRLQILKPFPVWDGKDVVDLPILVKTKGKTTTDHISPAGQWLLYRGHLDRISDNMFLGAVNAFTGEAGRGLNVLTGERGVGLAKIARDYKAKGVDWVVIGDENYGEGSSREHAAMSPRYLGCRAVIVRSFARIHETNLKKQGVLPLVFADPHDYDRFDETDRVSVLGLGDLAPGTPVTVVFRKPDGSTQSIKVRHSLTDEQIEWFKAGSALNAIK